MQTIPTSSTARWTIDDLERFSGDRCRRYEIIDGELFVTRAPHWRHQTTCVNIAVFLRNWINAGGSGEVAGAPGLVFSVADSAIPDVVWASNETLARGLDDRGHLVVAPELVVEVLSPGTGNQRRDREIKLKLYSARGVREYWIGDWRERTVEIYRRENGGLKLAATLGDRDELASPLLPGFSCQVAALFV